MGSAFHTRFLLPCPLRIASSSISYLVSRISFLVSRFSYLGSRISNLESPAPIACVDYADNADKI